MAKYFELAASLNGNGAFRLVRNAKTKKEIAEFVKARPNESIYQTVYEFHSLNSKGQATYDSAIFDKIFVEIDSEGHSILTEEAWREMRKLIKWCREESSPGKELRPQIFYSGRSGYHILFHLDHIDLNVKSDNVLKHLIKKIKQLSGVDIDVAANNGFSQLRRLPNTKNHKSGLYCIPLTLEEAEHYPPAKVIELAKKKRRIDNYNGPSTFFNDVIPYVAKWLEDAEFRKKEFLKNKKLNKKLRKDILDDTTKQPVRPCILKAIESEQKPNHQTRTYIALELIRCNYTDAEIHEIYKNIDPVKYKYNLTQYQIDNIRRKGLYAPSCNTLLDNDFCMKKMCTKYKQFEEVVESHHNRKRIPDGVHADNRKDWEKQMDYDSGR